MKFLDLVEKLQKENEGYVKQEYIYQQYKVWYEN